MNAVTTHESREPNEGEVRIAPYVDYVLAPDKAIIVRAAEVAECASKNGLRATAYIYHTSPATIHRFLRQNGYVATSVKWASTEARDG